MAASSVVRSSGIGIHLHTYADISRIDHNGIICTRCLRGNLAMPDDVSALQLVLTGDPALVAIVRLALIVSLSAVFFAALIGVPFGAMIALTGFPGRDGIAVVLNAMMGLPPVVVGLAGYLALSRSG